MFEYFHKSVYVSTITMAYLNNDTSVPPNGTETMI